MADTSKVPDVSRTELDRSDLEQAARELEIEGIDDLDDQQLLERVGIALGEIDPEKLEDTTPTSGSDEQGRDDPQNRDEEDADRDDGDGEDDDHEDGDREGDDEQGEDPDEDDGDDAATDASNEDDDSSTDDIDDADDDSSDGDSPDDADDDDGDDDDQDDDQDDADDEDDEDDEGEEGEEGAVAVRVRSGRRKLAGGLERLAEKVDPEDAPEAAASSGKDRSSVVDKLRPERRRRRPRTKAGRTAKLASTAMKARRRIEKTVRCLPVGRR